MPIISYSNPRVIDLTSTIDPKYCQIDCVKRQWAGEGNDRFTFTIARLASAEDARKALEVELERVQQLYSNRDYPGIGLDDPYYGEGDTSWFGWPIPGTMAHGAYIQSEVIILVEWTLEPRGIDLEYDFLMVESFVNLQFDKLNGALGTPIPYMTERAECED